MAFDMPEADTSAWVKPEAAANGFRSPAEEPTHGSWLDASSKEHGWMHSHPVAGVYMRSPVQHLATARTSD